MTQFLNLFYSFYSKSLKFGFDFGIGKENKGYYKFYWLLIRVQWFFVQMKSNLEQEIKSFFFEIGL